MNLLLIVISIHFGAGALGILLINRKLTRERRRENWLKFVIYLFIYSVVTTSVLINKNAFLGICIIIFSLSLFEILKLGKRQSGSHLSNSIFFISLIVFSVITLFFSLFVLLQPEIIVYTYTIVIIFDGASQISGQLAGKRKILPVLSPEKTVGGLIGGTLSAVITSVILNGFAGISVLFALFSGIVICLAAFLGDMAASTLKRAYNAKDFGNILPGQGGMLDRFDSFLAAGAVTGLIGFFTFFRKDTIDVNIAVYLGYSLSYAVFLLTGEFLYLIFRIKAEYSRIFSHVLAGVASLFMIRLFSSQWYIILLCIQSAIFMFMSKKMGILGSHHKVIRNTTGSSIFFAGILAAYLMAHFYENISLFILPIAILTISDPVASVAGLNRRSGFLPGSSSLTGSSKTYIGSFGFFVSSFLVLIIGIPLYYDLSLQQLIIYSSVISLITTITEAVSTNGIDNLSIPLVSSGAILLMLG